MLKKITIKPMAALMLLSTCALASYGNASSENFSDPLAERDFKLQAQRKYREITLGNLESQFQGSLTSEQQRMQSVLRTLTSLGTETKKESERGFFSTVETNLEVVVTGNALGYPQFLEALLTAEINDPLSPMLQAGWHNGPMGHMHYQGCALSDAPKIPLVSLLSNRYGFFDGSENNAVLNGALRFPEPNDPHHPMGDMYPNLEPEIRGTPVSDYIKEKVLRLYRPFNTIFTADVESLLEGLNGYMAAAPLLLSEIQAELNFHTHSLKTLIELASRSYSEGTDLSESDKMLAALLDPELDYASMELRKHLKDTA